MIYVLVNNDYQLTDALENLGQDHVFYIAVSHRLDEKDFSDRVGANGIYLNAPNGSFQSIIWPFGFGVSIKCVSGVLGKVSKDDVLVFYTEYEKLNHWIVNYFRRRGGGVYLLEDGGFATYVQCGIEIQRNKDVNFSLAVRNWMYSWLYGMRYSLEYRLEGKRFGRVDDRLIDAIMVYRNTESNRDIEMIQVRSPKAGRVGYGQKYYANDCDVAVYLNQEIYFSYTNWADYFNYLNKALSYILCRHGCVMFRFHPREGFGARIKIKNWIQSLGMEGVRFEDSASEAESIYANSSIGAVYSHSSSASFSAEQMGLKSYFMFGLDSKLSGSRVFKAFMFSSGVNMKREHEGVYRLESKVSSSISVAELLRSYRNDESCSLP